MAQFRNTADILDEVLQKSGEPTNGNSAYEALARTYVNKAHHAIIAGGSIFNLEVDEPWVWARSPHPITFDLLPPFKDGNISATAGSNNISFTSASSVSLEGWHLQANGKSTVYKIMNHTAGGTTAQLDSGFIDDSGSYGFRSFKIDYEILPSFIYVDSNNDRLNFQETAATTRTASLTHGAYTPANYLTHVVTQLGAVGTASWGGSYDSVLKLFNVTSSVVSKLFGQSGNQYLRSAMPTLGFDRIDYTGAQSYTSTYKINQISRLIEPFKLFGSSTQEPFIYSSDTFRMQQDYPISRITERIPDRFCRLTEDASGAIWVRFNSYPTNRTKISADWIPQPIDLQDNTASIVRLPRADIDTLIHAGCAFVTFDKEDSKYEAFLQLARAGLDAMRKKNRALLFRTGEYYGQIIPRLDYVRPRRKFRYGYTADSE